MRLRAIIFYWLLILVPTVLIGVAMSRLLRHEGERMARQSVEALETRTRLVAERTQLAVQDVQDGLLGELRGLSPADPVMSLEDWRRTNPLIRNVFVWHPVAGLIFPQASDATREERQFMARYEGLFSGRVPWDSVRRETGPSSSTKVAPDPMPQGVSVRNQLSQLARNRAPYGGREAEGSGPGDGGWWPWFEENRLHLLGWVRAGESGVVFGVELDSMVLLSRLLELLPASVSPGCTLALLDGDGRVMHQVGEGEILPGTRPLATTSLAPGLPHWQVAIFGDAGAGAGSDRRFVLLSGLLLLTFVAAILLGGGLLTWQARLHLLDARRKTSFVSNVSHELKTPLTSIRMYADLLNEDRVRSPERRKQYLEVIAAESQRLTRLVNNVLDFSRLEQGRKQYQLEDIPLGPFLSGVLETQAIRLAGCGLVPQVPSAWPDVTVRFDRDALGQIFINLIDNAIKYACEGKNLAIEVRVEGAACRVRVMDRGPGVPADQQERIFEKFYRLDTSLTARQQGCGLGLSLARGFARDLGGEVICVAREGGGSVFEVRLPLAGSGAGPAAEGREERS